MPCLCDSTKAMKGKVLKVMFLNNSYGYSGSYLNHAGDHVPFHNHAPFLYENRLPGGHLWMEGVLVTFVKELASEGEFSLEIVKPPFPRQVQDMQEHIGYRDDFTGCALGTSIGVYDLCVGSYSMSIKRLDDAQYLPMIYAHSLNLVVVTQTRTLTFADHMHFVFAPFTPSLWLLLLFFCDTLRHRARPCRERCPGRRFRGPKLCRRHCAFALSCLQWCFPWTSASPQCVGRPLSDLWVCVSDDVVCLVVHSKLG